MPLASHALKEPTMSKLTQALIPGYGANPTKPNSNPLKGLAPNPETGLPTGLPSGVGKVALRASNPVGGFSPDVNGDWGYQKGWLDQSSNGTPDAAPKGPGYSVWGDPDITKRGWGWGMDQNGKLQTGVVGGGPAGSIFGPGGGSTTGAPGSMPAPQATGQAATNLGQLGHNLAGGMQGLSAGASGLPGFGQALARGIRQFNANGGMGGAPGMPQQGGAMGAGGMPPAPGMGMPQGMPPMGPSGAMGAGTAYPGGGNPGLQNSQAIAQLISQMRSQQQQQAQVGQLSGGPTAQ
jgi:hypothetical protein